jgi:prepilin-type N-terminal cleavage/methylation domain-containing protein
MTRRRDARGFMLIEVLVALVLLSVAVVATLQLFGGGLRLARMSGEHLEATLLASAKLTESGLDTPEEGVAEGTEGDYRWVRRVTLDPELLPPETDPTKVTSVRLARVSVEVRWGRNRHVELVTLRAWTVQP